MTEITITKSAPGYRCDRCSTEATALEGGGLPSGWSSRPAPSRHFCYECTYLSGAWREDDDD